MAAREPHLSAYAGSKAALARIVESVAEEVTRRRYREEDDGQGELFGAEVPRKVREPVGIAGMTALDGNASLSSAGVFYVILE